jgi:hypothetical protein
MSAQFDSQGRPLALPSSEDPQTKHKLNIFEKKDNIAVKRDDFRKLGFLQDDKSNN